MPNPYPPEFRARVLALLRAGKTVQQVATELGLSDATIYNWRRQDEIDTGLRPGLSSPQAAELAAARRRIRELEEEVMILNRAAEKWKPVVPPKERFALIAELADQGCSMSGPAASSTSPPPASSPGANDRLLSARYATPGLPT